jgi:hypothetical protein
MPSQQGISVLGSALVALMSEIIVPDPSAPSMTEMPPNDSKVG